MKNISVIHIIYFFHIFTYKKKQNVFSEIINLVILPLTTIEKKENNAKSMHFCKIKSFKSKVHFWVITTTITTKECEKFTLNALTVITRSRLIQTKFSDF